LFEKIEIGSTEDDGTGDSLRDAFTKVNANFLRLAEYHANIAAQLGDALAATSPQWPGEFVPRHVTEHAPDIIPPMLGAIWVDASNRSVYVSVGTQTKDDWVILGESGK